MYFLKKIKIEARNPTAVGVALLSISIIVVIFASNLLYRQTVNLLTDNLRQRLLTISVTVASNIDSKNLDALQVEEDWKKPEWARVVNRLHNAKYSNKDVVFMYIFRKHKDDPSKMEFVADADSIDPYANTGNDLSKYVDVNRDGKIEPDGPDKLQWPGQDYPEAVDIPETFEAYNGPLTSKDLYTDDYGTVLTGYAPIKDDYGNTVAVLATDIKADDFFTITKQTLEPFLMFIAFLTIIISILVVFIIYAWKRHTKSLEKDTHALYEQNAEIVVKNKTLSLLEKLYQKSILTSMPDVLAKDISDTIRDDLNMEFAGIFLFDKDFDSLIPLNFSKAQRLKETMEKLGFMLRDIKITEVKNLPFFKQVVYDKQENMTNDLEEIWGKFIKKEELDKIKSESHIKTMIMNPLLTGNEVLGVLLLGLNRDYATLNVFEKDSIKSFVNIIALSLDKAYLYKELQDANISLRDLLKQRESLVHLVTHKVKGSFTHSKYIFAGILDGTFGTISPEIKKVAEQGLESDNLGIETVNLVLNAANMAKGLIKYDLKSTDLKEIALKSIAEKKVSAEAKGLKLETEIKDENYNVLGDAIWLKEVINNLIENAIKYNTKDGKITVGIEKKEDKVKLYVKDTGIGITEEDKKNLFTEGGRGKDSVKVNVDSTGYGLYTVKLVLNAHKGRVWAESETGKGSTFFIELPAA